jgi:hypothetical protein
MDRNFLLVLFGSGNLPSDPIPDPRFGNDDGSGGTPWGREEEERERAGDGNSWS